MKEKLSGLNSVILRRLIFDIFLHAIFASFFYSFFFCSLHMCASAWGCIVYKYIYILWVVILVVRGFLFMIVFQNTGRKHPIHRIPILIGMGRWHGRLHYILWMWSIESRLHGKNWFDIAIFCQRQTFLHSRIYGPVFGYTLQWSTLVSIYAIFHTFYNINKLANAGLMKNSQ